MKFSLIAIVLSAVVSSPVVAEPVSDLPVAVYISHGEDCALPLEGYENTDWFPSNYYPAVTPVWTTKGAKLIESTMNRYSAINSIVYFSNMTESEQDIMLQAMENYHTAIMATGDEDYIDCLGNID